MNQHAPRPSRHYVLAAGGTGGHLIPAFALATELAERGHHVALVTDERGAAIPGKPEFLPAHVLPAGRFGKNPVGWIAGVRAVMEGRRMALRQFEHFQPSAVIGFGGYPALPALLASKGYRSLQTGKWWEGNYVEGGFTAGMTHGEPAKGGRHGDEGPRRVVG